MATSWGIDTSTYTYDGIFAGNHPVVILPAITIASGQNLTRGTCLAKKIDGKYYKWDLTPTLGEGETADGIDVLVGILAVDTDATNADIVASMYVHGVFDKTELTAVDSITTGWYNNSILIKESK